ncbi:S-adenosyl-L-methionine-dependent methyltransferase [Aspergillus floccosus]
MTLTAQYDDPSFFNTFSQLPRNTDGLSESAEWPIISRNIGQVRNQAVLDLGCGCGWFCGWASANGASSVHGVDYSENMLKKARELNRAHNITYEQGDLDMSVAKPGSTPLKLRENAYDLIHSGLAFHYPADLTVTFAAIYKALKPGGRFVFSVQHPTNSAPQNMNWGVRKDGGTPFWELESYGLEGPRTIRFVGHTLKVHHRTVETYVSLLLKNGFTLVDFKEYHCPPGSLPEAHPDNEKEIHRPMYLVLAARKSEAARAL